MKRMFNWMYINCSFHEIRVSGKFPEITWQHTPGCLATDAYHPIF